MKGSRQRTADAAAVDDSIAFLLSEAIQGLTFVRDSSDPQARVNVLPHIISSLSGMVPQLGDKRPAVTAADQNKDGSLVRTVYRPTSRRRQGEWSRGRGQSPLVQQVPCDQPCLHLRFLPYSFLL